MKVAFYSAKPYDKEYYEAAGSPHQFTYIGDSLDADTVALAEGHHAICISPRHPVDGGILSKLKTMDISLVVVRSSGYDNIDLIAAARQGIIVKNLPGYSPAAVAEYATALILALNRKIHMAYMRTMQGNFTLDGLMGFNIHGKVIGIIGMGRVGHAFARIMEGFGCIILSYDVERNEGYIKEGIQYVSLEELLEKSDIISIHSSIDYDGQGKIINSDTIKLIKKKALLINTSRGKLVDTQEVLKALENERLGGYGADVYENEAGIFHHIFQSLDGVNDPLLKKLIGRPDVLITSNQAHFTREAMRQSAKTVINELTFYEQMNKHGGGRLMI